MFVYVCVCVKEGGERDGGVCVCVCVCVCVKEGGERDGGVCVCVKEGERETEVCVCVCVCVKEGGERDGEMGGLGWSKRKRVNSFLIITEKFSVTIGALLSVFGSCERHSKLAEEMHIL